MEKYKTIQEDIEQVTNQEVIKKSIVSMTALTLIVVAIILGVIGMGNEDPNASWTSFLFTASVLLFLGGIIKFFISRSCWLFRPTNSKLKEMTLYFDVHESSALQACIEMRRFEDLKQMKREKDSGVRVEVLVSNDQKFAAVQISEYIPYTYEAVTPVVCYYGEEAKTFISLLK